MSMYANCVPVLTRALSNLQHILQTGSAHAQEKKIDESVFINARLSPDMFALARQVQIATDVAKGAPSRLAGSEPPKYEDNEKTFAELIARVEKTRAHIQSFKPAQIDGSENKDIVLPMRDRTLNFTGAMYLQYFVIPNVFFHSTTTYAILRHNGVALGKQDFLGKP